MDSQQLTHLQKGLKAIVVNPSQDRDLMTVVYIVEVPATEPKDACEKAMEAMRQQLSDLYELMGAGPAFEVIDHKGTITLVDYNEVDDNEDDGSVREL
jgi:hypothetical protein